MFKQHIPHPKPLCTKTFPKVKVYVDHYSLDVIISVLAGATKDAAISSRALSKLRINSWAWIWLIEIE